MKNNNIALIFAYIKIIITVIFFSSTFHLASFLNIYTDPYSIIFLRYFIAAVVLLIFKKFIYGYYLNIKQIKENFFLYAYAGAIGFFIYFLFFMISSKIVPVLILVIIFALTPSLTSLTCIIFLNDRLKLLGYLGLFISLLGTISIINVTMSCGHILCYNFFGQFNLKYSFALTIILPMILYYICTKIAIKRGISSIDIVLVPSIIASILAFMVLIVKHPIIYEHLTFKYWMGVIYIALPCTAIGYVLLSQVVGKLGISKTSIFLNTIPIIAILIETILYHKKITLLEAAIISVIILGVIMVNISKQN